MVNNNGSTGTQQCLLISDFNVGNLKSYLERDSEQPKVNVLTPDYGQVMQVLLDGNHACWNQKPDIVVVWTQPESIIGSFGKTLQAESVSLDILLQEVDQFAEIILETAARARTIMVSTWAHPVGNRGLGPIDLRPGGIGYALTRMNLRLADRLHTHSKVFVVDSERWVGEQKHTSLAFKYWYASKAPYSAEVFQHAAKQVKSLLRATAGLSRKLLILDLDDTLWGGTIGDIGWENVRLGGHDAVGEAFQDFQRGIKALQNRGIVLAVVSKNDEATALQGIDSHPEMLIRRQDLAAWRINWQDKAQNVLDLLDELNLGIDAAVFIDDNPAERARVSEAIPQLYVPDWPADKLLYRHTLNSLTCFDPAAISAEDARRAHSYVAERERRLSRASVSMDEWLHSLQLKVRVTRLGERNLQRAVQLLNKTNQMNLSTRRMTEAELDQWVKQNGRTFWTIEVADRFGDSGLTGLLSTECASGVCRIVDFVLSCRVFGRHVENVMASIAVSESQRQGAKRVEAVYQPTKNNRPTLEFFSQRSDFSESGSQTFVWDSAKQYLWPAFIDVSVEDTQ